MSKSFKQPRRIPTIVYELYLPNFHEIDVCARTLLRDQIRMKESVLRTKLKQDSRTILSRVPPSTFFTEKRYRAIASMKGINLGGYSIIPIIGAYQSSTRGLLETPAMIIRLMFPFFAFVEWSEPSNRKQKPMTDRERLVLKHYFRSPANNPEDYFEAFPNHLFTPRSGDPRFEEQANRRMRERLDYITHWMSAVYLVVNGLILPKLYAGIEQAHKTDRDRRKQGRITLRQEEIWITSSYVTELTWIRNHKSGRAATS